MTFNLTKRQKIIAVSVLVTIILLSTQLVNFNLRFRFLAGLTVLTYFLSLFALWEGLNKQKAIVLLILPTLFTLAVASFYFLLPIRWLTRLPVAFLFGLSFYSLMLSQNVFNVAAIRTIPLYRAASTVNLLFTLITAFFLFNVLYSLQFLFIWNGVVTVFISFPLILQALWSIEMEDKISLPLIFQSLILSLVLGELALSLSFWPLAPSIWSLALASSMYVLLGMTTLFLRARLTDRVVREFVLVSVIIGVITFLTSSWTG